MTVGFTTWFPKEVDTKFVVKNIAKNKKNVRVFHYPIPFGKERDLMSIPSVSEADIRHSLLKGELLVKLKGGEIIVVDSNIDLIQFDATQKAFLQKYGVVNGLEAGAGGSAVPALFRQGVGLIGETNGENRIFTVPNGEKFVNGLLAGHNFSILVRHNGRGLSLGVDFVISESEGAGTGFDTVNFVSFIPSSDSVLEADYVIEV